MKILGLLATLSLAITACAKPAIATPQSLNNATVMISNKEKSTGGSGVIYRSGNEASLILTNSHVCGILEKDGGLVITNKAEYVAERYKRSVKHDICMIEVVSNLGVNTNLAKSATFGERVQVSGHPYLLPNTLTEGYLSNLLEITLLIDNQKCTDKEYQDSAFLCFWFGGMPIIKNYTAQTISAVIAPGNSGSGVFNSKGEIIGLAFAGMGRGLSHGLMVPLEYVKVFVQTEANELKWVEANSSKRLSELMTASVNTRAIGYPLVPTKQNLERVIFPAIKSQKIDYVVEKVEACRKDQSKCSATEIK
jgi:S1-C subfamily serine protease